MTLVEAMESCEQTPGLSVLAHGRMVHEYARRIIDSRFSCGGFRWPGWCRGEILDNLHPDDVVERYLVNHDCGKFWCRVVVEGKVHFPNHAEVSGRVWREHHPGDEVVARLIGWDMDLHTMSASEIDGRLKSWSRADACTLLVASLAEIHANASMFGKDGTASDSFKIKFKQLDRRGRQVVKHHFE